jgi:hypothetical protein
VPLFILEAIFPAFIHKSAAISAKNKPCEEKERGLTEEYFAPQQIVKVDS